MNKKTILITGVCGFIFTNFVRDIIPYYQKYNFIGIDKIISSYNIENINPLPKRYKNYKFYMGDICDQLFINNIFNIEKPDFIINGAAESFVCDSIKSALEFENSNVRGTQVLIDASVKYGIEKFIQISTDEVYGQLKTKDDKSWTEDSVPAPRNPYSATKYAAEVLLFAANQTHGLQYNITRCCNNYGKFQPYRNLIPKIIISLLNNKPITIHGDGSNIREWINCYDHCNAIMTILENGVINNIYNIGSGKECEISNLDMVYKIANYLKKDPIINYIENRKGHDFRYSINCDKLRYKLGWIPTETFNTSLNNCIEWYKINWKIYNILLQNDSKKV